jgi:cell division protein FtsL
MTTARATQPVTRPLGAPGRRDHRRPALRVVDTRRDGSRRSMASVAGTVLATVLFASVFSVVICQVLLVQTQSRLDDIDHRLDAQATLDKQLRHDIAGLESPERIVTEATENLDMVAAPNVGYLQPQPDDDQRAALESDGVTDGGVAAQAVRGRP